ncbi:hypothetical protein LAZ67_14000872 [Cordylochernes scorpioides]|uniref:Reverse transcriptase domain-containing protein n=1 Tax=Cordylochernes scorpioides TaxID=51811 RepID=A0ABY6L5R8_9ARAC|nr:hypothetical protein LAZ67_14000872 [Cordylochernes scorpioides]
MKRIISPEEHKSFLPDTATESYIYGLPKLHKLGIPLRPIVAHFLSPMAPVSKFISSFLLSLLKGTPSLTSITSTSSFIDDVYGTPPCTNLVMVSFDVVSLYPSLPHDLIVDSLRSFLADSYVDYHTSSKIIELTHLCLQSSVCSFNSQFFSTDKRVPNGEPSILSCCRDCYAVYRYADHFRFSIRYSPLA